jgi:hypothetical protein
MKFRRMREVYWLEASAKVTRVIEKVTPTTLIMEPAMVVSIPRAPAAPAPKRRGQSSIQSQLPDESTSIRAAARTELKVTINDGRNQKLARRLPQRCMSLYMNHSARSDAQATLIAISGPSAPEIAPRVGTLPWGESPVWVVGVCLSQIPPDPGPPLRAGIVASGTTTIPKGGSQSSGRSVPG